MTNVKQMLNKLSNHEKSARAIGSIAEAESFAAKIQELLFRHKLEMTDVEAAEEEKNEPVLAEYFAQEDLTGDPYLATNQKGLGWVAILVNSVVKANFCKAVGGRGKGNSVTIFGRKSDRENARALFQYLYETCRDAAPDHCKRHFTEEQISLELAHGYNIAARKRTFLQGFKLGFAVSVANRLDVQKKELTAGASQQGLIRIDQLAKQVDSVIHSTFPRLRQKHSSGQQGGAGYHSGKAYGSAVGINSTKRLAC